MKLITNFYTINVQLDIEINSVKTFTTMSLCNFEP